MKSFWLKIGFGALGVFLAGMMLITLGRHAKTAAAQAITTALQSNAFTSVASAASDLPFRLEGDRIGTVQHVSIHRGQTGALPEVNLVVQLSDPGAERQLHDCVLLPERDQQVDFDRGFTCAEGMKGDLVEVGRVQFIPANFNRPIVVTRNVARDMSKGDPFEANADLGGAVRINVQGNGGELVRLLADHHGASVKVNDELGRAVLRLFADSTGATIRVKDDKGRNVVSLDAGDGKLSLTVDTTGH
jgi:hypothetical protein